MQNAAYIETAYVTRPMNYRANKRLHEMVEFAQNHGHDAFADLKSQSVTVSYWVRTRSGAFFKESTTVRSVQELRNLLGY